MDILKVALLAIVEGITEFLPISSTGHMILVEEYFPLSDRAFADSLLIIIQLPAILAVVVYFWKTLWPLKVGRVDVPAIRLWVTILAAFLPAALLGFLFDDFIEEHLFNPLTVALALLAGGVVLLLIEWRPREGRFATAHAIPPAAALGVGLIQCVAMVPGVSRSAATIIGAMLLGASRPAAAEFSFFLAIPTMIGATGYTLMKKGFGFTPEQWALAAFGSILSFLTAYAVIAAFMSYIRTRNFVPFAWYRIALGILVLLLLRNGS